MRLTVRSRSCGLKAAPVAYGHAGPQVRIFTRLSPIRLPMPNDGKGARRVIANRKLNGGRKPKFKHEPLPSKEGLHSANIPTNLQDVIAPFFL
jgi:hypothetical protein